MTASKVFAARSSRAPLNTTGAHEVVHKNFLQTKYTKERILNFVSLEVKVKEV